MTNSFEAYLKLKIKYMFHVFTANQNPEPMAEQDMYSPSWTRPQDVMKIRKLKTQKRRLQDRLFE